MSRRAGFTTRSPRTPDSFGTRIRSEEPLLHRTSGVRLRKAEHLAIGAQVGEQGTRLRENLLRSRLAGADEDEAMWAGREHERTVALLATAECHRRRHRRSPAER